MCPLIDHHGRARAQKMPLSTCVIACRCRTGKSTITQQLAARLNLPNVLRTSVVYDLLRVGGLESGLHALPLQAR